MDASVAPTTPSCSIARESLAQSAREGRLDLPVEVRAHVDACPACWSLVVELRWTLGGDTSGVEELKEFLGDRFEWGIDSSWRLAEDWKSKPRATRRQVEDFYRITPWYAYNLVLWEACGQRRHYVDDARDILDFYSVSSVLDLGAGVGTDALRFAESGLETFACEYDNESSRFMLWRAARRRLTLRLLTPGSPELHAAKVDMLWAMDVLEHLPDPESVLSPILHNAMLFVYDTEHSGNSAGRQPFHYQHSRDELARIAADHDLKPVPDWWEKCKLRVFARARCAPNEGG